MGFQATFPLLSVSRTNPCPRVEAERPSLSHLPLMPPGSLERSSRKRCGCENQHKSTQDKGGQHSNACGCRAFAGRAGSLLRSRAETAPGVWHKVAKPAAGWCAMDWKLLVSWAPGRLRCSVFQASRGKAPWEGPVSGNRELELSRRQAPLLLSQAKPSILMALRGVTAPPRLVPAPHPHRSPCLYVPTLAVVATPPLVQTLPQLQPQLHPLAGPSEPY